MFASKVFMTKNQLFSIDNQICVGYERTCKLFMSIFRCDYVGRFCGVNANIAKNLKEFIDLKIYSNFLETKLT